MAGVLESDAGVTHGPIQHRLLALLAEHSPGAEFVTGLAARSSLGPCVLTVSRGASTDGDRSLDELGRWLAAQPGVEEVADKRSHLHVLLATATLRSWLEEGLDEAGAAADGRWARIEVPVEEPDCSLSRYRRIAVGHSVAAALAEQGFEVTVIVGEGDEVRLTAGASADAPGSEQLIEIAEVDARHDRLRARHGGVVTLEDLIDDAEGGPGAGRERGDGYGRAVVNLLLTGGRRQRRLTIDDDGFRRRQVELDEIVAAEEIAAAGAQAESGPGPDGSDEESVRELIAGVESAVGAVARVASGLDPVQLNRLAGTLARDTATAQGALPAGDPLWGASARTLDRLLRLLGADASEVASATALAA
jgi:hypothetical protein